jgi:hypothetical protein
MTDKIIPIPPIPDLDAIRVVGHPSYANLGKALESYDPQSAISSVAALLTVPEYHPQTIRIEMLLHLVCHHCRGFSKVGYKDLMRWLEHDLGKAPVRLLEDPTEDVFVSNVIGPRGNYRILDGTWERGDFFVQQIMECVRALQGSLDVDGLQESIDALLTLSDAVAGRSGLGRGTASSATVPSTRFLHQQIPLADLIARITFTREDLLGLNVRRGDLEPFMLPPERASQMAPEIHGNTSLEKHPLVSFGDTLVFACPTAVSAAIRRFTLNWVAEHWDLDEFARVLGKRQGKLVFDRLVRRVGEPPDLLTGGWPADSAGIVPPVRSDVGLCAIDRDKIGHVILHHDSLKSVRIRGLVSNRMVEDAEEKQLEVHLRSVAGLFGPEVKGGLVLFISGGLGRGRALNPPALPPGWHFAFMSLPDFETFAWADGASLLRLWKLLEEWSRLSRENVEIPLVNGFLNLYAYWEQQDFVLIPPRIQYPSERHTLIGIPTDDVRAFRQREHARNDVHAAPFDGRGAFASVRRLHRDPFFEELAFQPVYAALEFIEGGLLTGVVEGQRFATWVHASDGPAAAEASGFYYKLWEGLLDWLNRVMPPLEATIPPGEIPPLHVRLRLLELERWEAYPTGAGDGEPALPVVSSSPENMEVEIGLPYGFLALVNRPRNDAERALLEAACAGLLTLIAGFAPVDTGLSVQALVRMVMPTADERALHLFSVPNPPAYLAMKSATKPRLLAPEDQGTIEMGLGWVAARQKPRERNVVVRGQAECVRVLNAMVDIHWSRIRQRLEQLDARSVCVIALKNSEALHGDREHWRRTSRALFALHGGPGEVVPVAAVKEGQRAIANQAARVLVEMALSTCPADGGRAASHADYDFLSAGIAALLRCAADSDAIRGGLTSSHLTIRPNGTVEADESLLAEVTTPYVRSSFSRDYRATAAKYDDLFRARDDGTGEEQALRLEEAAFVEAFRCEYGLTPLRFLEGAVELTDFAMEEKETVPVTQVRVVATRLREKRGFDPSEITSFLAMISLTRRERWDKAPQGYTARDWQPWHFRRRLSVVSRPVLLLGEGDEATVLFGAYQVGASAWYLLEGIQSGWFPSDFFASMEMRRYIGSVAEKLGHAFTQAAASELSRAGWEVRTEVQMRTVGAPKALGDLDIIAWHAWDPRVLLIECKRLQPVRNPGEIVERLNQFRGDAGDRLGKHLRRCEWVGENFGSVQKTLRLPDTSRHLVPVLMTNSEVPMQYKRDLALSPEFVVPLSEISERLQPDPGSA